MKIRFFILISSLCAAVSCGTAGSLAVQQYQDDIYSAADKASGKERKAEMEATDSLLDETRAAFNLLDSNGQAGPATPDEKKFQTVQIGETKVLVPENATVNIYNFDTRPWSYCGSYPYGPYGWYGPYGNPWYFGYHRWCGWYHDPWFYSPWHHDPWYYDPWYCSCSFGDPWFWDGCGYWDPCWYYGHNLGPWHYPGPYHHILRPDRIYPHGPVISSNTPGQRVTAGTASPRLASPVRSTSGTPVRMSASRTLTSRVSDPETVRRPSGDAAPARLSSGIEGAGRSSFTSRTSDATPYRRPSASVPSRSSSTSAQSRTSSSGVTRESVSGYARSSSYESSGQPAYRSSGESVNYGRSYSGTGGGSSYSGASHSSGSYSAGGGRTSSGSGFSGGRR